MADYLKAAGDVVEYLGDVLTDLTHRTIAGRADLARLVRDLGARQMLGKRPTARRFLPQRRIALRCRHGHGDDLWRGGGRLGLQLIKRPPTKIPLLLTAIFRERRRSRSLILGTRSVGGGSGC